MWKNLLIWSMMLVLLVGSSLAAVCEDVLIPGMSCTMITPSLSCTNYSYDIVNIEGQIVLTSPLILLNQSIYQFQFNQSAGDYVVRLCDNTTRVMRVTSEDNLNLFVDLLLLFSLLVNVLSWMVLFWTLYRLRLRSVSKKDPIRTYRVVRKAGDLVPYWIIALGAFLVNFFCGISSYVATPATPTYVGVYAVLYGISMSVQLQFFVALITCIFDWFT